ncbi:MAG: S9 family peptidase [Candidatus Symbiothrix sp.]|jgi:dipeptidyl aminopeptidase/acylaminoacyl peptidase|nr:S9 family peptidase [Candidatus Symbiothrix sp.]
MITKLDKLPGNTAFPSSDEELDALKAFDKGDFKYHVEDYFSRPKASQFQLSPNGKYMSYREKDENNKRHIFVKDLETAQTQCIVEEKDELIRGYGWINDERLVYVMDEGGNENYHIYAADTDGSNPLDLTPFDDVKASILNDLKDQKDYIIISMNKNNPQVFEPYKLNVVTGEMQQLFENCDLENPIDDFIFDKDGELRGYNQLENGLTNNLYYKDLDTDEFHLLQQTDWHETFEIVGFNYPSENKNEAYVATNLDSDTIRIVLYDLKKNCTIREIFAVPGYDTGGIARSRKRNYEIDYFSYEGEKSVIVPVSDFYKDFHARMAETFAGKDFYVVDHDDDEKTYLIIVQSDRLFGTYYQYNTETKQFSLLYDLMPQLKEEDMAEMRPITFKSRDGLSLHGYITLPNAQGAINRGAFADKFPLIVNPHGGPQGVRDSWGFNPECQLFASRGYATLQVNFRISGGYGKFFLRSGFKQVGRKVMDDIEDGVQYVLSQGWIDPSKIAIYGGSHGGYAALMGLIKTPDLYACGVDYVGVSNIFTLFASIPEYWKPYLDQMKEIWYDIDDSREAEIARSVSPVYQADKIKKPLLVVQGANDPRVNINESDQIVAELRDKGFSVPYLVKYNEGHGFHREENLMEMYRVTLGFLGQWLS